MYKQEKNNFVKWDELKESFLTQNIDKKKKYFLATSHGDIFVIRFIDLYIKDNPDNSSLMDSYNVLISFKEINETSPIYQICLLPLRGVKELIDSQLLYEDNESMKKSLFEPGQTNMKDISFTPILPDLDNIMHYIEEKNRKEGLYNNLHVISQELKEFASSNRSSYTVFYDQMVTYAAIRKGQSELRSNKLTYGDEKLDYSEERLKVTSENKNTKINISEDKSLIPKEIKIKILKDRKPKEQAIEVFTTKLFDDMPLHYNEIESTYQCECGFLSSSSNQIKGVLCPLCKTRVVDKTKTTLLIEDIINIATNNDGSKKHDDFILPLLYSCYLLQQCDEERNEKEMEKEPLKRPEKEVYTFLSLKEPPKFMEDPKETSTNIKILLSNFYCCALEIKNIDDLNQIIKDFNDNNFLFFFFDVERHYHSLEIKFHTLYVDNKYITKENFLELLNEEYLFFVKR